MEIAVDAIKIQKTIYTLFLLSSVYILVDCIPFFSIETSQEIYVFTNIILRSLVVFMLFTPIMIKLKLSEDINKLINEFRKRFLDND